MLIAILLVVFAITLIAGFFSGDLISILIVGGIALVFYKIYRADKARKNVNTDTIRSDYDKSKKNYEEKLSRISLPENVYQVYVNDPGTVSGLLTGVWHYCWSEIGQIHLFPFVPNELNFRLYIERDSWKLVSIPIDSINVYTLFGEFYRESKISGGGSDKGKAIAGAIMFGEVGAIVGGSPKEIKTETIEHDTRFTQLSIGYNNQTAILNFDKGAYWAFQRMMPEKDAAVINEVRHKLLVEQQMNEQRAKEIKVPNSYRVES